MKKIAYHRVWQHRQNTDLLAKLPQRGARAGVDGDPELGWLSGARKRNKDTDNFFVTEQTPS
jgi:hypothetical protein